jgi:hypothetical protein
MPSCRRLGGQLKVVLPIHNVGVEQPEHCLWCKRSKPSAHWVMIATDLLRDGETVQSLYFSAG